MKTIFSNIANTNNYSLDYNSPNTVGIGLVRNSLSTHFDNKKNNIKDSPKTKTILTEAGLSFLGWAGFCTYAVAKILKKSSILKKTLTMGLLLPCSALVACGSVAIIESIKSCFSSNTQIK